MKHQFLVSYVLQLRFTALHDLFTA